MRPNGPLHLLCVDVGIELSLCLRASAPPAVNGRLAVLGAAGPLARWNGRPYNAGDRGSLGFCLRVAGPGGLHAHIPPLAVVSFRPDRPSTWSRTWRRSVLARIIRAVRRKGTGSELLDLDEV